MISKSKSNHVLLQYTAAFTASITAIGFVCAYSWPSPALPYLLGEKSEIRITKNQSAWIASLYPLGLIIGYLLNPLFVDRIGRKRTLLMFSLPQVISWFLIIMAKSSSNFYVARIIGGVGYGGGVSSSTVYISEIGNVKNRGVFLVLLKCMMNFGFLFTMILGAFLTYKNMNLVLLMMPVVFVLIFIFMPDSSYFRDVNRKKEEQLEEEAKKRNNFDDEANNDDDAMVKFNLLREREQNFGINTQNGKVDFFGVNEKEKIKIDDFGNGGRSKIDDETKEVEKSGINCKFGDFGPEKGKTDNFEPKKGNIDDFRPKECKNDDFEPKKKTIDDFGPKERKVDDFEPNKGKTDDFEPKEGKVEDFEPKNGKIDDFEPNKGKIDNFSSNQKKIDNKNGEIFHRKKFNLKENIFWKLYSSRNYRRALEIMLVMGLTNILSGHAGITTFTQQIFTYDGAFMAPEKASVVLATATLIISLLSVLIVERIRRKMLIAWTGVIATISLVFVGIFFFCHETKIMNVEYFEWIPLFGITTYDVMLSCGMGNVFYVYQGELFANEVKSELIAFNKISYMGLSFLFLLQFQNFIDTVGTYLAFFCFAFGILFGTVAVYVLTPETRGVNLQDIQVLLKSKTFFY